MKRQHRTRGIVVWLVILGSIALGCDEPGSDERLTPAPPLATDLFDRATEAPMGGNWTSGPSTFTDLRLSGNVVKGTTVGGNGAAYYHAAIWPDDQWSEVRVTSLGSGADGGAAVRVSASAQAGYVFVAGGMGTWYALGKFVDGSYLALATGRQTFAAGDVLRLEVQGSTLSAFRNGALIRSVVDASLASGNAGIFMFDSDPDLRLDDWAGGGFRRPG